MRKSSMPSRRPLTNSKKPATKAPEYGAYMSYGTYGTYGTYVPVATTSPHTKNLVEMDDFVEKPPAAERAGPDAGLAATAPREEMPLHQPAEVPRSLPVPTTVMFMIPLSGYRAEGLACTYGRGAGVKCDLEDEYTGNAVATVKASFTVDQNARPNAYSATLVIPGTFISSVDTPQPSKPIYRVGEANFHIILSPKFRRYTTSAANTSASNTDALKLILWRVSQMFPAAPEDEARYLKDMLNSWPPEVLYEKSPSYFSSLASVSEVNFLPPGPLQETSLEHFESFAMRIAVLEGFLDKSWLRFPKTKDVLELVPAMPDFEAHLKGSSPALRDACESFLFNAVTAADSMHRRCDPGRPLLEYLLRSLPANKKREKLSTLVQCERLEKDLLDVFGARWMHETDVEPMFDNCRSIGDLFSTGAAFLSLLDPQRQGDFKSIFSCVAVNMFENPATTVNSSDEVDLPMLLSFISSHQISQFLDAFLMKVVSTAGNGYIATLEADDLARLFIGALATTLQIRGANLLTDSFCEDVASILAQRVSTTRITDAGFVSLIYRLRVSSRSTLEPSSATQAAASYSQKIEGALTKLLARSSVVERAAVYSSDRWCNMPDWLRDEELKGILDAVATKTDMISLYIEIKPHVHSAIHGVAQGARGQLSLLPPSNIFIKMLRTTLNAINKDVSSLPAIDDFTQELSLIFETPMCKRLTQLMLHEPFRSFVRMILFDRSNEPHLLELEEFGKAARWCAAIVDAVSNVKRLLTERRCNVRFLDAASKYKRELRDLETFEYASKFGLVFAPKKLLDEHAKFVSNVRDAWDTAIDALRSITIAHAAPFVGESIRAGIVQAEDNRRNLESKPLDSWELPSDDLVPYGLSEATGMWKLAEQSALAQLAYAAVLEGNTCTSPPPHSQASPPSSTAPPHQHQSVAAAVKAWCDTLDRTKALWHEYIVEADRVSIAAFKARFWKCLDSQVLETGAHDPMESNTRCRQHTAEQKIKLEESITARLSIELGIATKVIKGITCIEDAVPKIRQGLIAILDKQVVKAFSECCAKLQVSLPAECPEQQFQDLFEKPDVTVEQIVAAHRAMTQQPVHPLTPPRVFFCALSAAVEKGHFVKCLSSFPSVERLSQAVHDRTANTMETRDIRALNSFEQIHRAFVGTVGVQQDFLAFVQGRLRRRESFLRYMDAVSWCSGVLASSIIELPRVWVLLEDEVDKDNAVAIAMELSQATTKFLIATNSESASSMEVSQHGNVVVSLVATTERRGPDKPLSSSELEDVCFQLTLAGTNADEAHRSNSDVLSNYVTRYQVIKQAVELCKEVVALGHPRFQHQRIHIPMSMSAEAIELGVCERLRGEIRLWAANKVTTESKWPGLTNLFADELVACMAVVDQKRTFNRTMLAHTMKQAVPFATFDEVEAVVGRACDEFHEARQASSEMPSMEDDQQLIHRVVELTIEELSQTERTPVVNTHLEVEYKTAVEHFSAMLKSEKLLDALWDDPASDVVVIKVPASASAHCSAVAIAAYCAILGRCPLPHELYFCNEETSSLAAEFVRRWGVVQRTASPSLLFGLTGVHSLPPQHQAGLLSSILDKRSERRRRCKSTKETHHSKLFLVIADNSDGCSDSLVAARLRGTTAVVPVSSELVSCAASVCKVLCQSLPILLAASEHPMSGKTQAVLRLAHDNGMRYASAIVDGSSLGFVKEISNVTRCRSSALNGGEREPIVLHLSVSHGARGNRIHNQLLEFGIQGRLLDPHGIGVLRAPQDTVVVELPSQGHLHATFRNECPSLHWFKRLEVREEIQLTLCRTADPPAGRAAFETMHAVVIDAERNDRTRKALRVLAAFREKSGGREQRLPHHETLDTYDAQVPTSQAATALVHDSSDAASCTRTNFGAKVRYMQLLTSMLTGVYDFALYQSASASAEQRDRLENTSPQHLFHNYRALAFFLVKFCIECAEDLAAASVPSPSDQFPDEATRLERLPVSFHNVRRSFIHFTGDTYEFSPTASNDVDFLAMLNERWNKPTEAARYVWDRHFDAMARDVASRVVLSLTQALRSLLRESDESRLDTFTRLLPVLGLQANFGIQLITALGIAEALDAQETFISASANRDVLRGGSHELRRVSARWCRINNSPTATVGDFVLSAQHWLQSLTPSSKGASEPFVLTADSFGRLLAIKTRLQCSIPVVFQGETGQGKTHLLRYMSKVSGTLFEVISIHRGVKPSQILEMIQRVEQSLRELMSDPNRRANSCPIAIVVLDEVNSMTDVWLAKSIVCDRMLLGRTIMPQIHFVCIMNPWRRQTAQITPGLDFIEQGVTTLAGDSHDLNPQRQEPGIVTPSLVYDVNQSPESFMCVVWQFGLAHKSTDTKQNVQTHLWGERVEAPSHWTDITDEDIFAECSFSWNLHVMATKPTFGGCWEQLKAAGDVNGNRHFKYLRTFFVLMTRTAQEKLRQIANVFSVSLRDIRRTATLIPFLYDLQVRYHATYPTIGGVAKEEPFRMLQRAFAASFTLNYLLRLTDADRETVQSALVDCWRNYRHQLNVAVDVEFMVAPDSLFQAADTIAEKICEALLTDDGIAVNGAMKENVLSLFCSIFHPIAGLSQIIAGKPGSTKSAALDALVKSSDCTFSSGDKAKNKLFMQWYPIKKFVIQCTAETTAESILRVARSAAEHQRLKEAAKVPVQCILVLEEVGIAAGAKHNPLMILHSLIDNGVVLDDGTVVRIPIVGISNYALDAAKMNRMRLTLRGNPRLEDLKHTARTLIQKQARAATAAAAASAFQPMFCTPNNADVSSKCWDERFCQSFRNLILADTAKREVKRFYGMRDFYSFVSMMKRHLDHLLVDEVAGAGVFGVDNESSKGKVFLSHLTWWALQVNFGGHPNEAVARNVIDALGKAILQSDSGVASTPTSGALTWNEPSAVAWSVSTSTDCVRPMCDMCARMELYTYEAQNSSQGQATTFPLLPMTKNGDYCPANFNADTTARSVLAYALHRPHHSIARLYRVRNVLLFSRGNAGVELLFRLGYVNKADAEVIDPRDPAHVSPQQIMADLSRVRRCLRTNKTLILVRAAHLYEAMFDVLNQHFSVDDRGNGDVRFSSTLTVDGFTSTIQVSPDHRIILIEDQANTARLTSPFLNRCIKVQLDYESALSAPQLRVLQHTRRIVNRFGDHVPNWLIPGYSDDTLASMILDVKAVANDAHHIVESHSRSVLSWLHRLVCPRRLTQARLGLVPSISVDAVQEWECNPLGSTLYDLLEVSIDNSDSDSSTARSDDGFELVKKPQLLKTHDDDEKHDDDANNGKDVIEVDQEVRLTTYSADNHLFVLTEQRAIPSDVLMSTVQTIFESKQALHPETVNFLSDDAIDQRIAPLNADDTYSSSVPIFIVDFSLMDGDAGAVKLDSLFHRVAVRCPQQRNVVIVAVLPSTVKVPSESGSGGFPSLKWKLTARPDWTMLFLDEVAPSTHMPIEPHLLGPSTVTDKHDESDDAVDGHGTQHHSEAERTAICLKQAYEAVGTERPRAVAQFIGCGRDWVERIEEVVKRVLNKDSLAFHCLRDMFVHGVMSQSPAFASGVEHSSWMRLALLSVTSADSLREQLTTFLLDVAQRAVQQVIPAVMTEQTDLHFICEDTMTITAALVQSRLVISEVDYVKCAESSQEGALNLTLPSATALPDAPSITACQFPFSTQIELLLDASSDPAAQQCVYDKLFETLTTPMPAKLVHRYCVDVVRRNLSGTTSVMNDCVASLLLICVRNATEASCHQTLTLVDVHKYFVHHRGWLSDAAEWSREIPDEILLAIAPSSAAKTPSCEGCVVQVLKRWAMFEKSQPNMDSLLTLLVETAASASRAGVVPLPKVHAVRSLLPPQVTVDNWTLSLHSGLSLLPPMEQQHQGSDDGRASRTAAPLPPVSSLPSTIQGILRCQSPSEVVSLITTNYTDELNGVAQSLVHMVLSPSSSSLHDHHRASDTTIKTMLVDNALNNRKFPASIWASALRDLIRMWRDEDGIPIDAFFGPVLLAEVHRDPNGECATIVSRCFFDVWHERNYLVLQQKVAAATSSSEAERSTTPELLTLLRVARCGIDNATGATVVAHFLFTNDQRSSSHQDREDATSVQQDPMTRRAAQRLAAAQQFVLSALTGSFTTPRESQSAALPVATAPPSSPSTHRRDQLAWYMARTVYFAVRDLKTFRELLNNDRKDAHSLLPQSFYSIAFVNTLTSEQKSGTVFNLFHGFAVAQTAMMVQQTPHSHTTALQLMIPAATANAAPNTAASSVFGHQQPFLTTCQHTLAPQLQELILRTCASEHVASCVVLMLANLPNVPWMSAAIATDGQAISGFHPDMHAAEEGGTAESRKASRVRYLSASIVYLTSALFQSLVCEPQRRLRREVMSNEDLDAAVLHAVENILIVRCPQCALPFDSFDGCFALTCVCHQCFCGWCFATFPNLGSVYNHLQRECPMHPRNATSTSIREVLYGSVREWEVANNTRRVNKLNTYLNSLPYHREGDTEDVMQLRKSAVLGTLAPKLHALGIDVASIVGVDAHVPPSLLMDAIDTSLQELSAVLYGNANGVEHALWWFAVKLRSSSPRIDGWESCSEQFTLNSGEDTLDWVFTQQRRVSDACHPDVQCLMQLNEHRQSVELELPDDERRAALHNHFYVRVPFDPVPAFWDLVASDDRFAVLRPLHAAFTAIPRYLCSVQNMAYCRIFHMIRKMQDAALQHRLTRQEAQTVSVKAWATRHAVATDAELSTLDADVNLIWTCIKRVGCKRKDQLVDGGAAPQEFASHSAPVAMLLPGASVNDKDGGFPLSLLHGRADNGDGGWKGLVEASDEFHSAVSAHYHQPQSNHQLTPAPRPTEERRRIDLLRVQPQDLPVYDERSLAAMLSLFIDPTSASGAFTRDVDKLIQWTLTQPGVYGKAPLGAPANVLGEVDDELIAPFKYFDDASSSIVVLHRRFKHHLELLSQEMVAEVQHLMEADPGFAQAARSLLVVIIRELASTPSQLEIPLLFESVIKTMTTPLTPIQLAVRQVLSTRLLRLKSSQVVALLAVVWDPATHMTPLASRPLPDACEVAPPRDRRESDREESDTDADDGEEEGDAIDDDDDTRSGSTSESDVDIATLVVAGVHHYAAQGRLEVVSNLLMVARMASLAYLQNTNVFDEHFFDASITELIRRLDGDGGNEPLLLGSDDAEFEDVFAVLSQPRTIPYMANVMQLIEATLLEALRESNNASSDVENNDTLCTSTVVPPAATTANGSVQQPPPQGQQQIQRHNVVVPRLHLSGKIHGGFALRPVVEEAPDDFDADTAANVVPALGTLSAVNSSRIPKLWFIETPRMPPSNRGGGGGLLSTRGGGHPAVAAAAALSVWEVDPCLNYGSAY